MTPTETAFDHEAKLLKRTKFHTQQRVFPFDNVVVLMRGKRVVDKLVACDAVDNPMYFEQCLRRAMEKDLQDHPSKVFSII